LIDFYTPIIRSYLC